MILDTFLTITFISRALVSLFGELDREGKGNVSHEVFASFVMQVFADRFIRETPGEDHSLMR